MKKSCGAMEASYWRDIRLDPDFAMYHDGVHPSPIGHRLMGQASAEFHAGKPGPARQAFVHQPGNRPQATAIRLATPQDPAQAPLVRPEATTAMPLSDASQVLAPQRWGGPRGLSAVGHAGWDQDYLYLTVAVTDNVVLSGEKQPAWESDGIEFFIDVRAEPRGTIGFAPGYYQLLVPALAIDGPAPVFCGRLTPFDTTQVKAGSRRT